MKYLVSSPDLMNLLHNLFTYALVYDMNGIVSVLSKIFDCGRVPLDSVDSLIWACSSIRRRVVVDLGRYPSERVMAQLDSSDSELYRALVICTKIEMYIS